MLKDHYVQTWFLLSVCSLDHMHVLFLVPIGYGTTVFNYS